MDNFIHLLVECAVFVRQALPEVLLVEAANILGTCLQHTGE